jgi:hypothetical protein
LLGPVFEDNEDCQEISSQSDITEEDAALIDRLLFNNHEDFKGFVNLFDDDKDCRETAEKEDFQYMD